MALLEAEIKRAYLRSLYRQCPDNVTFISALEGFQDYCLNQSGMKGGRLINATSQSGHSVQIQLPAPTTAFTPDQVFSLSEELIAVYNEAVATLANAGNNSPTDQQIFDTMIVSDSLATVTEVYHDYTGLRFPTRL